MTVHLSFSPKVFDWSFSILLLTFEVEVGESDGETKLVDEYHCDPDYGTVGFSEIPTLRQS
jgi:hypothetical protein